uniref:Uncharacterized protein n=1 Tax=Arundo donax TaxID=35708 RepID=A0A0A9HNF1_ARUDO
MLSAATASSPASSTLKSPPQRHRWCTRQTTTSRSSESRSCTRLIPRNGAACASSSPMKGTWRRAESWSHWKPPRRIC